LPARPQEAPPRETDRLEDGQLLDRWRKRGDAAAFEVLVWRHGTMAWNVCRRLLGREQDAEGELLASGSDNPDEKP
jgi:hypothetical protein